MEFVEPLGDFLRWVGSSIEFWGGLAVVIVVALVAWVSRLLAQRWVSRKPTQRRPGHPALDGGTWEMRNTTASPMIEALAGMRAFLVSLDATDPKAPRRLSDRIGEISRVAAQGAHAEIQKLSNTHAILLPDALKQRWRTAVDLLGEYSRGATQGPDRWPGEMVNRAQCDVDNYLVHMTDSLAEYVTTGTITQDCDPPVLRRADMETWQPCETSGVGTPWERMRRQLANWRGMN